MIKAHAPILVPFEAAQASLASGQWPISSAWWSFMCSANPPVSNYVMHDGGSAHRVRIFIYIQLPEGNPS
jgi:hypothetical protein